MEQSKVLRAIRLGRTDLESFRGLRIGVRKLKVAIIVGIPVGVGFLVAGRPKLIAATPVTDVGPYASTGTYGPVGGNLPEIVGIVLVFAGIATIAWDTKRCDMEMGRWRGWGGVAGRLILVLRNVSFS